MTPVVTTAPVIAWVVDTGRASRVARYTQIIAPSRAASANCPVRCAEGAISPLVKVETSPAARTVAVPAPAPVQSDPYTMADRYFVIPLPTRVAMVFEISFAPLE